MQSVHRLLRLLRGPGARPVLDRLRVPVPLRGRGYSTYQRKSLLMSQFEKVKQQYADYVVLFQVGDFYEIYGDDAGDGSSAYFHASCSFIGPLSYGLLKILYYIT